MRLLEAIEEAGSVAKASTTLGRSRARALSRIETLESAFGDLVERHRGGSSGGGSRVTENARRLCRRYERLQAALAATAQVPETVLEGTVTAVSGELADVETEIGTVRGLHDGRRPEESVQVRVGADALTVLDPGADPAPNATSARNQLPGCIERVEQGETVCTVVVDGGNSVVFRALVTQESMDRLELVEGRPVVLTWKATATRVT